MIKAGDATEVEVKERKVTTRYTLPGQPSKRASVPGGGVALLRAAKALDKIEPGNDGQKSRH